MPHGDAVIHGDGIKFFGDRPRRFDFARDQLPHVFEVYMAGNKLGKAVDHGDDGLAEVFIFHAGRTPQSAGTSHIASGSGSLGTERDCLCHDGCLFLLGIETIKPTAGGRLYGKVGLDIATEGCCRRIVDDFKHADDFFHPGDAPRNIHRSHSLFFADNAE